MTTNDKGDAPKLGELAERAGGSVERGRSAATDIAGEAWSAARETGSEALRAVQQEAEVRGEKLKAATTDELETFASAIRAASQELSDKRPGMMADVIRQAASGLEGVSEALRHRSSGEIVDAIRDFGRRNPMAFIAGSVLTGFALGRFAGSSASHSARQQPNAAAGYPRANTGANPSGVSASPDNGSGALPDSMTTGG